MNVHRTIAQVLEAAAAATSKGARRFGALGAPALAGLLALAAAQAQGGTPLTGANGIAAGDRHACALLSTGGIKCWGNNDYGKLGDGTTTPSNYAIDVQGIANAVDVAAGRDYGCAVTDTGGVKCWGMEPQGNHGSGSASDVFGMYDVTGDNGVPLGLDGKTARRISAGLLHACAIVDTGTDTGAVYCWGNNEYGQLGNGIPSSSETIPVRAGVITGATAIAAGESHTCAIVAGGAVECWGDDFYAQLGDGVSGPPSATPVAVTLPGPATSIAAGDNHTCAQLASGEVACWGWNYYGQLGTLPRGPDIVLPPAIVVTASGAIAVGAGGSDSCAVIGDGTVKCWGASSNYAEMPRLVDELIGATRVAVGGAYYGGPTTHCALVGDGVQCWGDNAFGQLGNGVSTRTRSPVDVVGIADAVDISAGGVHTCAALALPGGVKAARCWGANDDGQLGDGTSNSSGVPVDVYDLGATQVAAGYEHTCALRSDGVVACWGFNNRGQLGQPPSGDAQVVPANLSLGSVAIQVVAGYDHSCALLQGGTVWCWGSNQWGQLGLGNTVDSYSPAQVPGLSGVDEIAAGAAYTCARIGGAVKCWGGNSQGQVGNGGSYFDVYASPQDVVGLSNTTQITTGPYHACARLDDGTARCWGDNALGQLGAGFGAGSKVPVAVDLGGILQIAAGAGWTCARMNSGKAMCWGGNQDGQLGNPSVVEDASAVPVEVANLTDVVKLAAGSTQVCAITGTGRVKCWGRGDSGELGDGRTGLYGLPATVLLAPAAGVTATTLTSSPGASFYGQPVTLTATVFNGNAPTGTVAFSANGAPIAGCASVALAGGQAQCTTSALPIGTSNALAAVYSGDGLNSASTGTLTYEVTRAPVSLSITAHVPDPSAVLSPVKVTVALNVVPPGTGIPTGTVQVDRGGDQCTIAVPDVDPSCTLTPTIVGIVNIGAQYGGDANFATATAAAVAHTTTALAQTITFPVVPDRPIGTPAFIVSATASSGLTVAFASATPAVCTLSGNVVTLASAGTCTITADQAGNAIYGAAPQVVQSFTVYRTNATLSLSSSANPSAAGQSVAFTFVAKGDVGTPVGTVAFSADGSAIAGCANVALSGGQAQCTAALAADATIAADYSGDAYYLPGTRTLTQQVITAGPPAAYAIADVDYPAASETEVRALTDNGKLVGLATLAGVPTPFAYAAGAYAPLPGGSGYVEVSPWGIAGGGTVVGGASDSAASPTAGSGFTLTGSAYSLLARAPWPVTEVRGVNAAGTLVGYAFDPGASTSVAFIYDPATTTYTDIAIAAPGWRRIAHAINTAGQVVGSVDDGTTAQGFLREANGTVTAFQVSGLPTYARGINDAGVIAGYTISGGVAQGFVGNAANGYETLVVPGAVETVPLAINNAGQVAGYWVDSLGKRHGFIATPGQLPVGTTTEGGFQFDVAVVGGQPVFIDPAVAVGYDYAVGAGDPLFVAVRLPIGFGDNRYTVTANGVAMVVAGGELHDLTAHNAPAGVAAFRVTGIETSAYVDPEDPRGFPTEVTFGSSGRFTGTQTPIVVDAPWPSLMTVSAAPNPARAGQWIAYTATVTSPGGTPTGSVTFSEDRRTLCTAVLSAGVAQCSGPPLSIGDHAVVARYAGNAEFAAASQPIAVSVRTPGGKSAQSISFAPLPDRSTSDPPFTLSATASSGLPVSFTSATPFVCKVNGNVVNLTRVGGVCLVIAVQGGNASYLPALPVPRAFAVRKRSG